jgi:hypothetical protein
MTHDRTIGQDNLEILDSITGPAVLGGKIGDSTSGNETAHPHWSNSTTSNQDSVWKERRIDVYPVSSRLERGHPICGVVCCGIHEREINSDAFTDGIRKRKVSMTTTNYAKMALEAIKGSDDNGDVIG